MRDSKRAFLAVAFAVLAAPACGRVIINQPVNRQGDAWHLTLRVLSDGPNGYSAGNTNYTPSRGERFIWAHVTLHNDQPIPRKFNFDRCDLDLGDGAVVPALIDADAIVNWTANHEPELAPGETITRKLIFAYPRDKSPTRLYCAPMVIALPQF